MNCNDTQMREFVADSIGRIGALLVLVCGYLLSSQKLLAVFGDSIMRLVIPFAICCSSGAILWLMRRVQVVQDVLGLILCEFILFAALIVTFAVWPDGYDLIRSSRSTVVNYLFILTIVRLLCPVRDALWPVRIGNANQSKYVSLGAVALMPVAVFVAATKVDFHSDALLAVAAWLVIFRVPRLIRVVSGLFDELFKVKSVVTLQSKFTAHELTLLNTLSTAQGKVRQELLEFSADAAKSFPVLSVVVDNTDKSARTGNS